MSTLVHEDDIAAKIAHEVAQQVALWGEQNHPPMQWLAIIGEEFGEACKAANDSRGPQAYSDELVQVAACCINALDCLRRAWQVEVR